MCVTVQGEGLDPLRHRKTNTNTGSIVMRSIKRQQTKLRALTGLNVLHKAVNMGDAGSILQSWVILMVSSSLDLS